MATRRLNVTIPVLTYHSTNIVDNTYAGNDHVALASDLEALHAWGVRVVSLDDVAAWYHGDDAIIAGGPCVALTFDDGSDFDAVDIEHPTCGPQRSFLGVMKDHHDRTGRSVTATTFVIASPGARRQLDERSLVGRDWWGEHWWPEVRSGGFMSIGCHSWDHVHTVVDEVAQAENVRGDFSRVATLADCEQQVREAGDYIAARLGGSRPAHYAFPYGQFSAYMVEEYLPGRQSSHGFSAAWTTAPRPVTRAESRWTLPRFVCGRDWGAPDQFRALLGRVFP